jgi:hypothetical protein
MKDLKLLMQRKIYFVSNAISFQMLINCYLSASVWRESYLSIWYIMLQRIIPCWSVIFCVLLNKLPNIIGGTSIKYISSVIFHLVSLFFICCLYFGQWVPLLPPWVPNITKMKFSVKHEIILTFNCGDFNNTSMHYRDASRNTEILALLFHLWILNKFKTWGGVIWYTNLKKFSPSSTPPQHGRIYLQIPDRVLQGVSL